MLLQEGEVPETIHFLLDGRVIASSRDGAPRSIAAPAALGFAEALSGMPMPETMRTDGLAVTLVMRRSELRTLLADNTDLVSGLFATLSATPTGRDRDRRPTRCGARPRAAGAERPARRSRRSWRCSACRCSRGSRPTRCARSPTSPQTVDADAGIDALRRVGGAGAVAGAVGRGGAGLERCERRAANRPRPATSSARSK